MSFPLINPYHQFFDSSGDPLVSGTIEFRDPNTNDLINTYPTADDADAQTNANDNPLTLNASGTAPSGIYLENGVDYKVILKDSNGATITTQDDVLCPQVHDKASIAALLNPENAAETAASVTISDYSYDPGNAKRYGALGDGVNDDTSALQDLINYCAINGLPGYIPNGDYHVTRLYGKYDASNNPNGVQPDANGDFPRRFVLRGDGHLHDSASLSGSGHARTSIVFSATTGTLLDLSVDNSDFAVNANNTWQLRNLELEDFNLIGGTTGEVLDTSGAFKCRFHRLGIYNSNATGDGWKMHNFDQVNVEDVMVLGNASTSSGTGLSLKNDESAADGIDGSLSVFRKILVQDFALGYELGHDRDTSNGNFQQFNNFESCATAQCTVGMFIGDRWENNTFDSCQIRGTTHGAKMGSRAAQNTFNACLFQATNASTGTAGFVLGSGTAATAVQCTENTFNNCSFEQANPAAACLEIYGGANYANIFGNDFIDCAFEYTGTAGDGTKGAIYYTATSNGQLDFGSIIRPAFTNIDTSVAYSDTNWLNNRAHFEHQERTILHHRLQTTDNTPTNLGLIELATSETVSVRAHVIAVDTTTPSQSCAYNLHGLFYNNAGTATVIGSVTSVSSIEGDANCAATLDANGANVRIRITGDTSQTYNWRGIIEVLTAPISTVL